MKRLSAYANMEIIEVPDEKAPENMSEAEQEEVKRKEGEKNIVENSPRCVYYFPGNKGSNDHLREICRKIGAAYDSWEE